MATERYEKEEFWNMEQKQRAQVAKGLELRVDVDGGSIKKDLEKQAEEFGLYFLVYRTLFALYVEKLLIITGCWPLFHLRDENGPEEKQSVEEMEGQSQEADGVNAPTMPSPASEEAVEVCKDEDSAKDDNITKDNEVIDHSVCDQDQPNGQENDSTKNDIKIEAEFQSSCMETEELSSDQEDATTVEQPEVIPLTDDQEEKEGEKVQAHDTVFLASQVNGTFGVFYV
ncbi:PREDICTED: O-acetyl-ADP-ribose deacetylase MACROD2 [Ceratotherium simum simum]|uniref:O-acetyl-ADP-ribose deacetylase MACROD2 n=1 Tax=Ceratotherium simum simum TaxID=73337 RepID=A0ABM1D129_CERSS|nr:PREDICTED: O-acetyl-ADP-ribose deacetylase MACROD2 [Ceratotherium simum simum]